MRRLMIGTCFLAAGLVIGSGSGQAQNPTQPNATSAQTATAGSTVAAAKKRAARRRKAALAAAQAKHPGNTLQSIPMESAPPSPPTPPAVEAKQKAADQKLLQQQEQQSSQAAAINNQQVEQAQKQQDKIQNEVRIQDAPGPAQTGVVPAAGVPVAPVNVDDRIQDAPGPAQTLPPLPATTKTPATQPAPENPPQI